MHAYGVRESGGERVDGAGRRRSAAAGLDDLETAMRIDRLIHEAQAASPSYSSYVRSTRATHRQDWEETLADDDVRYFVAERTGERSGHATLYPDPTTRGAPPRVDGGRPGGARRRRRRSRSRAHALAYARGAGLRADADELARHESRRLALLAGARLRLTHIRLVRRLPDL